MEEGRKEERMNERKIAGTKKEKLRYKKKECMRECKEKRYERT